MSKQFDKELGTMMRTIRKEKRISIDHVAESLNVSVPAVHYWETGQRQINASALKDYCAVHFTNIKRTLAETGDVLLSVSMA